MAPELDHEARLMLERYGVPEDVIDGVLCLHAQGLAALQRLRAAELDLAGQQARIAARLISLIDPVQQAVPPLPVDLSALHRGLVGALLAPRYGVGGKLPLTATAEEMRRHRAAEVADLALASLAHLLHGQADALAKAAERIAELRIAEVDPQTAAGLEKAEQELRGMAVTPPPAPEPTASADTIVSALQAKAETVSDEAARQMRRDLEEKAQVWLEAAELASRAARGVIAT